MNIYDTLVNATKNYPDKVAVSAIDNSVSYSVLNNYAMSIASKLLSYGIDRGARVVLYLEDSIDMVAAIYGVNMAGMVFVPVSPQARDLKLQMVVDHSEAEIIITQRKLLGFVNTLECSKESNLKHIVILGEESGDEAIETICTVESVQPINSNVEIDLKDWNEEDMTSIFYVSDTLGRPKGIMLSTKNILSNMEAIIEYLKMSYKDNLLVLKSMAIIGTVTGEIIASIAVGAQIVIFSGINHAGMILKAIEDFKITGFFAVPVMLHRIVEYRRKDKYSTDSLRYIQIGAAKLIKEDVIQLMDMYPGVEFYYIYGVSEASPRVLHLKPEDMIRKVGSVGTPVKYCSVCLLDADKNPVRTGEIGEIYVQGPNVMLGYYKSSELTEEKLTEFGLKTGDLAYMDEDQYIYWSGRADNMINQGGIHIYPAEIESNIKKFDKVKAVKVEGIPDELLGNKIKATVTPIDGIELTEAQVYDFCLSHIEGTKIPKIIEIVKETERTE